MVGATRALVAERPHSARLGLLLSVVVASLLVVGSWSLTHGEYSLVQVLLLLYLVGIALVWAASIGSPGDFGRSVGIFTTAYFAYAMLVVLFGYDFMSISGHPFLPTESEIGRDDYRYYVIGRDVAEGWLGLADPAQVERHLKIFKYTGYAYTTGAVLYLAHAFGDMSPLTPRLVSALAGAMIQVCIYLLAKRLWDQRTANIAVVMSGLYVIWAYYGALGVRDIVIAFLILFTVLLVLRLPESKSPPRLVVDLVLIVGALAIIYWYRSFSCYAVLAAIGGALASRPFGPKTRVILVTGGFVMVAFALPLLIDRFEVVRVFVDQAERWGAAREFRPSSSSLAQRLIYGAPWPLDVPILTLYSLVMPVPPTKGFAWHEIVFGLGNSLWYFLVPFWAAGFARTWRNVGTTMIGMATLITFAGVAYIQPDVRHKTQYMGFAMIHVAVGWQMLGAWRRPILIGLAGLFGLLAAIYVFLKTM